MAALVLRQLGEAVHKHTNSFHVLICPKLMMPVWGRLLFNMADWVTNGPQKAIFGHPQCVHQLFLILSPPPSSHTDLGGSGGHPRLCDWEELCLYCYRVFQGMQEVFCANLGYYQRGWPPCQECWHRDCFSADLDRDLYYYGVMEDVEGIPWNYNPKYELRYKHLTNGVNMFMPFLGPKCHFFNIKYMLPTSSSKDRVFMMHITRSIMDAGWGREPSTIKKHMLEVNRNFIKCKDIVKDP